MKTLRTSVLLCAMTFSGGLFAQSYPLQEASSTSDPLFEEGFLELPVPMQIEADISHQVVRYFIDFSCEFCKGLRDVMATWGQTLPFDAVTNVFPESWHVDLCDEQRTHTQSETGLH